MHSTPWKAYVGMALQAIKKISQCASESMYLILYFNYITEDFRNEAILVSKDEMMMTTSSLTQY